MLSPRIMSQRGERGPVVLVDDDPLVLRVLTKSLENAGFRVIARESAFGLSALLSAELPSVVVLDVSMPGLDGPGVWSVARAVLAPAPSVIFYSANDAQALEALAARFPEARPLAKPAPVGEIVRVVEDAHRESERRGGTALRRTPPRGV
jgi:two-component system C4-dicarboxylate transport response regulator DctD